MKRSHIFNGRTFTAAVCLPLSATIIGTSFSRASFTTLERYFGLSSRELATYLTISQIISLFSPIFVNITSRWHIPRVLHTSFWFSVIGFGLLVTPYLIGPKYDPLINFGLMNKVEDIPDNITSLCKAETFTDFITGTAEMVSGNSNSHKSEISSYRWFLPIAYAFIGMGSMIVWPLALAYIDSNAKEGEAGILVALNYMGIMIGPVIGYTMGSFFLKIWVNIATECAPPAIDPRSSQWVGAWWMGYAIPMVAVIIFNIPLAFFPRKLKHDTPRGSLTEIAALTESHSEYQTDSRTDSEADSRPVAESTHDSNPSKVTEIIRDLKLLFNNPNYVVHIVSAVAVSWAMATKATFGQKYIEIQFGLVPAEASSLKVYTIITFASGLCVGGLVLRLFKFKALGVFRYNMLFYQLYTALFLSLAFLEGCTPQTKDELFGLPGTNQTLQKENCTCSYNNYNPICVSNFTYDDVSYDQKTVINPCFAGCDAVETSNEGFPSIIFGCVVEETSAGSRTYLHCSGQSVSNGVCNQPECKWKAKLFIAMLCFTSFIGGLTVSPGTIFSMRCVEPHLKAFGMSMVGLLMKIFGWAPAPIILGKVFDSLCVLHADSNMCLLYSNRSVRLYYFGILGFAAVVNAIVTVVGYIIFVRRLNSGKPMYGGMNTDVVIS